MTERSFSEPKERSFLRRSVDKAFLGLSFITLPLAAYAGITSLAAGEFIRAAVASGSVFLDYTQIKEHSRAPEQQSWYNPEKIMDKIWKGSNRLHQPSSPSMMRAAA